MWLIGSWLGPEITIQLGSLNIFLQNPKYFLGVKFKSISTSTFLLLAIHCYSRNIFTITHCDVESESQVHTNCCWLGGDPEPVLWSVELWRVLRWPKLHFQHTLAVSSRVSAGSRDGEIEGYTAPDIWVRNMMHRPPPLQHCITWLELLHFDIDTALHWST